ncbi:RHS repeat-associated core domain-containing protein, partial [Microbulbifer sp. TYP-18]|uniref:RHS repeat-associated core domain-containing protein n=1 Tax=Microbulbifer sp. TYP-18 TaxID=3230024 RepID=UPI0034C5EADB
NGYRVYNPGLMRFHAADSMSPFGRGGVNSYAYALGDPINLRDPSGHFALISLLIGAIIGAVIGAAVSAAVEGIRAAATGDEFDFKQVFIGAALGFISGGFGAAAIGAKTGVQVGIAVADAVVSGAADFGLTTLADLNNPDGPDYGAAGVGAGVGAAIGLVTFGLGKGIGTVVSKVSRKLVRQNNQIGFLLSPTGGKSKLPLSNTQTQALAGQSNPETGTSFFAGVYTTIRNSFVSGQKVDVPTEIPERKIIQDAFAGVPQDEMSPFARRLAFVNDNLASNGDRNIPMEKAIGYRNTALKVNSGEVSNSYAHMEAAGQWIASRKVPGSVRFVGASMNFAATFFAGAEDAMKYRRGKF